MKDLILQGLDGLHNSCDKKNNKHLCGLGQTIEKFIAQDSTNKLDSRIHLIDGVESDTALSENMVAVLKKSEWRRLRKRLGKLLSLKGVASVQVDIINGVPHVSLGELISYRKIAGELEEVILDAKYVHEYQQNSYPVYERFYREEGIVKKMFGIQVEEGWLEITDIVSYPANITRIPVKIFINNEDETSDIDNTSMRWAIADLAKYSTDLPDTVDLTKFGLIVNRNMSSGKTGAEIIKDLKEKSYTEVNGMDAQLGAGIQPTGAPGFTAEYLLLIDWLEDKIMKFTFTTRDTTASGTNKHNAEVGMFNQFAIEYLLDKKEIREEDYTDFYSILAMMLGEEFEGKVELQISQLLQNMLDAMNPETPQVSEVISEDKTEETKEEE